MTKEELDLNITDSVNLLLKENYELGLKNGDTIEFVNTQIWEAALHNDKELTPILNFGIIRHFINAGTFNANSSVNVVFDDKQDAVEVPALLLASLTNNYGAALSLLDADCFDGKSPLIQDEENKFAFNVINLCVGGAREKKYQEVDAVLTNFVNGIYAKNISLESFEELKKIIGEPWFSVLKLTPEAS